MTCDVGFVLSIDQKTCDQNNFELNYIDPSCQDQITITPHQCVACNQGYYFSNGSCVACTKKTPAQGCAFCDPDNEDVCLMCASTYNMDKKGDCVQKQTQPTTDNTGNQVTPSKNEWLLKVMRIFYILLWF